MYESIQEPWLRRRVRPLCVFNLRAAIHIQDSFLDHLVGKWVLRGELAHKQTTHDILAEWVLGHQYVRLHEISRETKTNGQPAYEAIVLLVGTRRHVNTPVSGLIRPAPAVLGLKA
jgi:hypothetical protein